MVGNGFNRRGAVGAIVVQEALCMLPKAPSPLEVNRFYWVVWRVVVETLMGTCSTRWRLYSSESLVDLVGIADFSWMGLTVVLLKSFSRLVYSGCECWYLNGISASRLISLLVLARRVNVANPTVVAPFLITNKQSD